MHLGHILAADGLDDVAFVVWGMEAGPAPSLGLTVQGSTARQWVLQTHGAKVKMTSNGHVYQKYMLLDMISLYHNFLTIPAHASYCVVVEKKNHLLFKQLK